MPDRDSDDIRSVNSDSSLELNNQISKIEPIRAKFLVRQATKMFKPTPNLKSVVKVRNATKQYGSGTPILNNLNMTVQKGTIYSLLGSSGCGKSTLLSCIIGIKPLNSGTILTFGAQPGTKESGIPGCRVGYMPQETALYNEFTIAEAIRYFGTLYGMSSEEIESGQDILIEFLDLPDKSRTIGTLSGGQKRRVSLAVSLIHGPELLILDEPTVGVDPLLRESIWNHLVNLVSTQDTTVIITTHYIEEASQSTTIGLMRGGRLLTEKSPTELLAEHNANHLEDIVLKLCRNDAFANTADNDPNNQKDLGGYSSCNRRKSLIEDLQEAVNINFISSQHRIKAIVIKNFMMKMRNLLLLFFTISPAIVICIVCISLGRDPQPMNVAFINSDNKINESCPSTLKINQGCDVVNLACQFMSNLPKDKIHLHKFETEETAIESVRGGNNWGVIYFPKDYSNSVYSRATGGRSIDNATITGSKIRFRMDMSNRVITATLKQIMYDANRDFLKDLLERCGFNPNLGQLPIKYTTPIYGKESTELKEYIATNFIVGIMGLFPICLSGISYIKEKKQGTLERSLVAGVQMWEIIVAFFMTEIGFLIIQAVLTFLVAFTIFEIHVHGSVFLAVFLCILIGFVGVSVGFLFGSFCNEEIELALLTIGLCFPCFALSGMFWPQDGMPTGLKYISYSLPISFGADSVRSIVSRGWGLFHPKVWPGFLMSFGWIVFACSATILNLRWSLYRR